MKPIPDHVSQGLSILFVGFNPSVRSSESGHHYANPTNRFWKILYRAGLTERKYSAEEDQELLELGYGLTNIVSRPTKAAADITKQEYQQGRMELKNRIAFYKPKVVCFVGKGVYQEYSKKRTIEWGVQQHPVVSETIEFVAPSSSGLVRMKPDEIVSIYSELRKYV